MRLNLTRDRCLWLLALSVALAFIMAQWSLRPPWRDEYWALYFSEPGDDLLALLLRWGGQTTLKELRKRPEGVALRPTRLRPGASVEMRESAKPTRSHKKMSIAY